MFYKTLASMFGLQIYCSTENISLDTLAYTIVIYNKTVRHKPKKRQQYLVYFLYLFLGPTDIAACMDNVFLFAPSLNKTHFQLTDVILPRLLLHWLDIALRHKVGCCLGWHLATQILYFIGFGLLLLCEIYSRAQLCCIQRKSVYRTLGIILLVSCKFSFAAAPRLRLGSKRKALRDMTQNVKKGPPVCPKITNKLLAMGIVITVGIPSIVHFRNSSQVESRDCARSRQMNSS